MSTDEQRKLIDELAESISRLCHTVIARRLEQFFEVIGEEVSNNSQTVSRLMDALNREPGESLQEWETRALSIRNSIRKKP